MRRRRMVPLVAVAVGLLAVTGAGAGAESASRLPYDFVLASYTAAHGCSVFINASRPGEGGRTSGWMWHECFSDRKMRVCIDVEGNEAYLAFEFPVSGQYLVWNLFLRDNVATGEPDQEGGLFGLPSRGRVSRVCHEFDGFGKGLTGRPVAGDINIHDG